MENIKLKYDDNGMGVWTAKAGGGNVTIDEHCHVTVIDPSARQGLHLTLTFQMAPLPWLHVISS